MKKKILVAVLISVLVFSLASEAVAPLIASAIIRAGAGTAARFIVQKFRSDVTRAFVKSTVGHIAAGSAAYIAWDTITQNPANPDGNERIVWVDLSQFKTEVQAKINENSSASTTMGKWNAGGQSISGGYATGQNTPTGYNFQCGYSGGGTNTAAKCITNCNGVNTTHFMFGVNGATSGSFECSGTKGVQGAYMASNAEVRNYIKDEVTEIITSQWGDDEAGKALAKATSEGTVGEGDTKPGAVDTEDVIPIEEDGDSRVYEDPKDASDGADEDDWYDNTPGGGGSGEDGPTKEDIRDAMREALGNPDATGDGSVGAASGHANNSYDQTFQEIPKDNITTKIQGWIVNNPLKSLIQGSTISVSAGACSMTFDAYGQQAALSFCDLESELSFIGSFVLGCAAIFAFFIAFGIRS